MRALLVAWVLAGAAALDWHVVLEEDGIQVAQQAVPGRSLPIFRAQGEFAAPLEDVLAVLFDIESQPSWLARCEETRVLETKSIADDQHCQDWRNSQYHGYNLSVVLRHSESTKDSEGCLPKTRPHR